MPDVRVDVGQVRSSSAQLELQSRSHQVLQEWRLDLFLYWVWDSLCVRSGHGGEGYPVDFILLQHCGQVVKSQCRHQCSCQGLLCKIHGGHFLRLEAVRKRRRLLRENIHDQVTILYRRSTPKNVKCIRLADTNNRKPDADKLQIVLAERFVLTNYRPLLQPCQSLKTVELGTLEGVPQTGLQEPFEGLPQSPSCLYSQTDHIVVREREWTRFLGVGQFDIIGAQKGYHQVWESDR